MQHYIYRLLSATFLILCTQINNEKAMGNFKSIFLCAVFLLHSLETLFASVVSTGDFNKDFFVTWSPSHVNTSSDGRSRSLKLDQESGKNIVVLPVAYPIHNVGNFDSFTYEKVNIELYLIASGIKWVNL